MHLIECFMEATYFASAVVNDLEVWKKYKGLNLIECQNLLIL